MQKSKIIHGSNLYIFLIFSALILSSCYHRFFPIDINIKNNNLVFTSKDINEAVQKGYILSLGYIEVYKKTRTSPDVMWRLQSKVGYMNNNKILTRGVNYGQEINGMTNEVQDNKLEPNKIYTVMAIVGGYNKDNEQTKRLKLAREFRLLKDKNGVLSVEYLN